MLAVPYCATVAVELTLQQESVESCDATDRAGLAVRELQGLVHVERSMAEFSVTRESRLGEPSPWLRDDDGLSANNGSLLVLGGFGSCVQICVVCLCVGHKSLVIAGVR